ncbi:uncharacterized protein FIESC28_00891 [Fusarium coffeatum]|uniref:Uncharacterized protein n=1 Tax=Fusarium coffeatum TaxID=231269 RepID=A0A366SC56_9HYPO|nr:uncharacterized protein FIESC28_00891 [Fusarium coffeatum]RBR26246.1 hypothetical protein FIESC28_00891 [Fusarium coffeatum]
MLSLPRLRSTLTGPSKGDCRDINAYDDNFISARWDQYGFLQDYEPFQPKIADVRTDPDYLKKKCAQDIKRDKDGHLERARKRLFMPVDELSGDKEDGAAVGGWLNYVARYERCNFGEATLRHILPRVRKRVSYLNVQVNDPPAYTGNRCSLLLLSEPKNRPAAEQQEREKREAVLESTRLIAAELGFGHSDHEAVSEGKVVMALAIL